MADGVYEHEYEAQPSRPPAAPPPPAVAAAPAAPPPPPDPPSGLSAKRKKIEAVARSMELVANAQTEVSDAQKEGLQLVREIMTVSTEAQRQILTGLMHAASSLREYASQLDKPPAQEPSKKGFYDWMIAAMEHGAPVVGKFAERGGGQKLLAALSTLVPGLGDALGGAAGATHEGDAGPGQQTDPPAPPPPGEQTPPEGSQRLPELAVLYDQLPQHIADNLRFGELRLLLDMVARLRAEGRPVTVQDIEFMATLCREGPP